ncbi:MAG: hypothetical protein ACRDBY_09480 [Cetobacterium sp.]
MNLVKILKDKALEQDKAVNFMTSTGEVLKFDGINNTATIRVDNQFGEGFFDLDNVKIIESGNGVNLANINVGDIVLINYIGNSLSTARIVGVATNAIDRAKTLKHTRQMMILNNKKTEIKKVLTQEELLFKYSAPINESLSKRDIEYELALNISMLGDYAKEDMGVTHPSSKATIKWNEDGDIILSSNYNSNITLKADGSISINADKIDFTTSRGICINGEVLKNGI